jgi:hypothetical protein
VVEDARAARRSARWLRRQQQLKLERRKDRRHDDLPEHDWAGEERFLSVCAEFAGD